MQKFYGSFTALFGLVLLCCYIPYFFGNLNTSEHGLSACTGNNVWYYKGILRKSGPGGGEKGGGAKNYTHGKIFRRFTVKYLASGCHYFYGRLYVE